MEETLDSHKFVAFKYWKNFFALISTILTNCNYSLYLVLYFDLLVSFFKVKMSKELIKRSSKLKIS